MRLALVDPEPPSAIGGGIRTYTRLAAALCRRQGWDVRIYTHNPDAYGDVETRSIQRLPFLVRGIRGLAYRVCHPETTAFEQARWLAGEMRRDPPDFVEFPDFQGYAYYALRDPELRRRVAIRIHTPLHLVYAESGRGGMPFRFLRHRELSCLRRARFVTAPSEEFISEKMPWLKNVRIIPNPPPPLTSLPASAAPSGALPQWGWGEGLFRILFLGRLEPRKGAAELLRAFISLAPEYPDATLAFIGGTADIAYHAELRRLEAMAPEPTRRRIQWFPAQGGDKEKLLRDFSCLVVPSLWENSPYVFWEGMAAGIPCLGTETGEMRRARHWTKAPNVSPGDPGSLRRALRELADFPELGGELVKRQRLYLQRVASDAEALPRFYRECTCPSASA